MSKDVKKKIIKKKLAKKKAAKKKTVKAPVEPLSLKKTEVKITAAKGRPMLTWVGKRPLARVTAFPAQHVESYSPSPLAGEGGGEGAIWKDWPSAYPKGGLLFHGDNKEVLAHLLASGFRGKVNLVYIDPPFDSGADYVRNVTLRGAKGTTTIDGETYTLGEQIQYTDIWANDNYLQFMYERLMLLKELLSENGSIYLHCDWRKNHHLRVLLDEVFGVDNFVDEIAWKSQTPSGMKALANQFSYCHETLLWYAKGPSRTFNKQYLPYSNEYIEQRFRGEDERGRYKDAELQDPSKGTLQLLEAEGRLVRTKGGKLRVKQYLENSPGILVDSVWIDIPAVNSQATERNSYPTQKPEPLIERVLRAATNPGDLVLDCFIGSGTTAAVAQKLGRRWIGCDINNGAIQTTSKRLQTIVQEQIEESKKGTLSLDLSTDEDKSKIQPAQSAFSIWRVNDYDLAIQHNEAVNLACEHIGIERMRTDAYFDGTYRKSLVKIIPFGHPLTPLDLEELKRELDARPDEDRPITVVCLGMEIAAKAWIEDWNRLRKGKEAVNKIEAIELRTDPKYGKFMKHEPAKAKVKISRKKDTISVEIEDFISPTIIERLAQQAGLLKPKIDDWRAMVDCVMVDTAYDGKVFNVVLSDVPEKKTDYVQGKYELSASSVEATVAVKIIDMLGEEVLFTKAV